MSKEIFEKLQSLAALELDEAEGRGMRQHLELMLAWFDELPPLGSTRPEGVAPPADSAVEPLQAAAAPPDSLRDDVVQASVRRSAILRNAPDPQDGCYGVPRLQDGDP